MAGGSGFFWPVVRGLSALRRKRMVVLPVFVWWIIVGLIAGWLAGKIMRGSGYGVIGDILLGIIGAIVGSWLLGFLHIGLRGGFLTTILVATLGAVVLVAIARLLKRS